MSQLAGLLIWFAGPFSITFTNTRSHRDCSWNDFPFHEEQNTTKPVRARAGLQALQEQEPSASQFAELYTAATEFSDEFWHRINKSSSHYSPNIQSPLWMASFAEHTWNSHRLQVAADSGGGLPVMTLKLGCQELLCLQCGLEEQPSLDDTACSCFLLQEPTGFMRNQITTFTVPCYIWLCTPFLTVHSLRGTNITNSYLKHRILSKFSTEDFKILSLRPFFRHLIAGPDLCPRRCSSIKIMLPTQSSGLTFTTWFHLSSLNPL